MISIHGVDEREAMMGLLDGWPFRNKEEIERRNREFDERVMPLGPEQKELALTVLNELKPSTSRNDSKDLLFGYLVGKDKYVIKGKGEDGMAAMTAELDKLKFFTKEEKLVIKALVKYDSEVINIDYYPSAEKIRAAIEMNFI
ncbi:MAG: hypothetical protein LBL54_00470 [Clostridiales Family XIII bacterium]|jgi:hypothetical protein|nr:hypothetical protein [Clostridiales Family XIII bacterium]